MRTNARGTSWTTIALGSDTSWCVWDGTPGCYITSLVQDPRRRNVLYVGTHGNGAFKVTGTTCSGDGCAEAGVSSIMVAPGSDPIVDAEELWFQKTADGMTLMCACGRQGFYRGSFPYTTLDQENTGIAFDTTLDHETSLSAIGGAPADPASAIYVGNVNALCEVPEGERNVECHTLYRSTDGGLTWEDVAFDQDVQKTVVGTTIEWWAFLCCRDNMLNQESYAANSILLTADDPPAVMVAGRSGVWKSTLDGDTHWQPAVQGMGTTIDIDAAVDPNNAGRAYVAGLDWTFFASAANLAPGTAVQSEPNKNFTHGFAIAVDSQTSDAVSPVYVGVGSNDVAVGGVYTSTDPTSPGAHPWTSLGFTVTGCDRTTPRVIGVGAGRLTPSATPMVFAATDGCGLWRYDGALWQNVSAGTDMFATENAGFRFAPVSYPNNLGSLLYVLDRQTGKVWASNNQGSPGSWVQVWQVLPPEATDTTDGSIVADPNAAGTLWLTTNAPQGLHQLSCPVPPVLNGCVDTGPPPDNVVNPGPIAIRPCPDGCTSTVYVATRAVEDDTTPPALFKHLSGSGTWCNLTTGIDPMYRRALGFPRQMAVSIDSGGVTTVYLATGGEGVLIVTDDTGDCGT